MVRNATWRFYAKRPPVGKDVEPAALLRFHAHILLDFFEGDEAVGNQL